MNVNTRFGLELFLSTDRRAALRKRSQQRDARSLSPEYSNHSLMETSDGSLEAGK